MPSLVERMREAPPVTRRARIFGFDPDIRTLGWAFIDIVHQSGIASRPEIEGLAQCGLIDASIKHMKEFEQAAVMGEAVVKQLSDYASPGTPEYVVLEGQQIYADPDMSRGELVAKANDMIALMHVSGTLNGFWRSRPGVAVQTFKPAEWKGQRKKEVMHLDLARTYKDVPLRFSIRNRTGEDRISDLTIGMSGSLPKFAGDALDALCMCVFGAYRVAEGRWT